MFHLPVLLAAWLSGATLSKPNAAPTPAQVQSQLQKKGQWRPALVLEPMDWLAPELFAGMGTYRLVDTAHVDPKDAISPNAVPVVAVGTDVFVGPSPELFEKLLAAAAYFVRPQEFSDDTVMQMAMFAADGYQHYTLRTFEIVRGKDELVVRGQSYREPDLPPGTFELVARRGKKVTFQPRAEPSAKASLGAGGETWAAWVPLLGRWSAEPSPSSGPGSWTSFELQLSGQVLVRKNHVEVPAAQGRAASVHDDLMVLYVEKGKTRADYWDNEGHVLRYEGTVSPETHRAVLTSDGQPGVPRYRLTYDWTDPNTVTVAFEVAPPRSQGAFRPYLSGKLRRSPPQAR